MNVFAAIAEERIREAEARGDFKNLAGQGSPLVLEDESAVPEDLRMAYKILRNSGFVPPELAEQKEINTILDLLESCTDLRVKVTQMRKLEAILFRMRLRRRSVSLEAHDDYYKKVVSRMSVIKKELARAGK